MKHLLGFSGGIDSQACARWLLNRYPAEDVILLNSDAGGNEHPITEEFLHRYSETVHQVVFVKPVIADMGTHAADNIKELGLQPNDLLTFDVLAKLKGRFPSRRAQFCTHYLKLQPQIRWITEHLSRDEFMRYSGVRREESRSRKGRQCEEWDDVLGVPLHHPIVDWTKQMCFDYVQHHGEEINELYTLGFNRVGCAPCVNSNKQDIRNWVTRFPEMIEKVKAWEQRVGKTFFPPVVPGKKINWIDDVVRWAKTVHGGKQFDLLAVIEPPACDSAYGLCE